MTQELSSLMDGELPADEAERIIKGCCGSEELKAKWQAYHLIGEALRGEAAPRGASTLRIMAAIAGVQRDLKGCDDPAAPQWTLTLGFAPVPVAKRRK